MKQLMIQTLLSENVKGTLTHTKGNLCQLRRQCCHRLTYSPLTFHRVSLSHINRPGPWSLLD